MGGGTLNCGGRAAAAAPLLADGGSGGGRCVIDPPEEEEDDDCLECGVTRGGSGGGGTSGKTPPPPWRYKKDEEADERLDNIDDCLEWANGDSGGRGPFEGSRHRGESRTSRGSSVGAGEALILANKCLLLRTRMC